MNCFFLDSLSFLYFDAEHYLKPDGQHYVLLKSVNKHLRPLRLYKGGLDKLHLLFPLALKKAYHLKISVCRGDRFVDVGVLYSGKHYTIRLLVVKEGDTVSIWIKLYCQKKGAAYKVPTFHAVEIDTYDEVTQLKAFMTH